MREPAPKLTRLPAGPIRLRLLIAAGLLAAMLAALAVGASPQALLSLVQDSHERWAGWVSSHLVLAGIAYALFYMLAVTISLPGALWFTIGAGFLLGATAAIPVSLFGITFGAANAWLIMRYLSGPALRQRFSDRIARFAAGFRRNEFAYTVLLRVLPLPFFLVNLAAGLLCGGHTAGLAALRRALRQSRCRDGRTGRCRSSAGPVGSDAALLSGRDFHGRTDGRRGGGASHVDPAPVDRRLAAVRALGYGANHTWLRHPPLLAPQAAP